MDKRELKTYGYGMSVRKEDITRCIASVSESGRYGSFSPHQCRFKRGYGKDGLYCKKHAEIYE